MMIPSTYYHVDQDNIEHVKNNMSALDQAEALEPGCETWGITYDGGQRGQMTRWPNGRGAICRGGDSDWGDWDGDILILDCGERVNDAGETVHEYHVRVYNGSGRRLNEAAEYEIENDQDAIDAAKSEVCDHREAVYAEVECDGEIIWTWTAPHD